MFCSSNPVPKKKEYVIPLIRKVKWRVEEGEGGGSGGASETDQVKTDEEMALDKEAAEAILSGTSLSTVVLSIG